MTSENRLPKYVYRQVVKGRLYYRFRRPGMSATRLPGIPGTTQFQAAYARLAGASGDEIAGNGQAALRYALEESLPRARVRAQAGGLPFDLTDDDVREMMAAQGYKCAVSGLPFHLSQSGERRSTTRLPFRPSIDRITPSLGYVRGNVRVLCFAVNMAIADWGDDVFRKVCKAVARKQ